MKFDLAKFSSQLSFGNIKESVLEYFGSSPKKYWPWFLFFFTVLFLASIVFSVFLFLSLSSPRSARTVDLEGVQEIKINLSGMSEAIKALDAKKADFDKALDEPLFSDPS